MKQSTAFLNLLQNLLSKEEVQAITKELNYEDPSRKLDTHMLIQYLVMAAFSEWKSFRHGADVAEQ